MIDKDPIRILHAPAAPSAETVLMLRSELEDHKRAARLEAYQDVERLLHADLSPHGTKHIVRNKIERLKHQLRITTINVRTED